MRLSLIVNRPGEEPGFFLERRELGGRQMGCTNRPYAAAKPASQRY